MINLRWNRLPAALLAAGLLLTTSLRADSAYMVTVTDIDKDTTTYEVLDRAGLSALKEKIKLETRHFPAALAAASIAASAPISATSKPISVPSAVHRRTSSCWLLPTFILTMPAAQ